MKTRWMFTAALLLSAGIAGFLFLHRAPFSSPSLVFGGYERSATNAGTVARLELLNTTDRTMWLEYGGSEFPLEPPFLERPLQALAIPTRLTGTNFAAVTVSLGHFFLAAEKVPPGSSLILKFPIRSGEPARQVGVAYYSGNFSDGHDFINNFGFRLPSSQANWRDRAAFYWQNLRRKFKSPERHEIWCSEAISVQADANSVPMEQATGLTNR